MQVLVQEQERERERERKQEQEQEQEQEQDDLSRKVLDAVTGTDMDTFGVKLRNNVVDNILQ